MCNLIASGLLICTGALGYAGPLDAVAERRYVAAWGGLTSDPAGYEVLLGIESCDLLGEYGLLIVERKIYSALIVDCQQEAHRLIDPMGGRGLLADVNKSHLNHKRGILILKKRADNSTLTLPHQTRPNPTEPYPTRPDRAQAHLTTPRQTKPRLAPAARLFHKGMPYSVAVMTKCF